MANTTAVQIVCTRRTLCIGGFVFEYNTGHLEGKELLEVLQEDLSDFKAEIFLKMSATWRRNLRNLLRQCGVYVASAFGIRITDAVSGVVKEGYKPRPPDMQRDKKNARVRIVTIADEFIGRAWRKRGIEADNDIIGTLFKKVVLQGIKNIYPEENDTASTVRTNVYSEENYQTGEEFNRT